MPPKKEGVSLFEQRRLQNIAANQAILKDISKSAVKIAKPPPAPKPVRRKRSPVGRSERPKREPTVATRASSRLKGQDPVKRERDDNVPAALLPPERPAKKARVSDDLSLDSIMVEGRKFNDNINSLGLLLPKMGADPGVRTFDEDDIKKTTDKDLKKLRESMNKLEMYDKWAVNDIKIVPQRIYSMGFHPTQAKPLIFAGDKEGAMGIFDASQEVTEVNDEDEDEVSVEPPVISAFKTHTRTISSFHFPSTDFNAVYTASYDSTIRKLDLGAGTPVSVQVFGPDDEQDLPISSIDMASSDPHTIIFSTLSGSVGRYDLRTKDDAEIWELSDAKIGGFSLHPQAPHLLATASLDRTMKIWDLRKITGKASPHPHPVGEHVSRLSVSHASWSPTGHVATSSYDDTIKIYDFSEAASRWKAGYTAGDDEMKPTHVVKHNNQTGRWVTILKPQWQRHPADGIAKLAIGNMNRFVDVYGADGEQLAQLDGEGITAVPAVAHLHPTQNWVVGGTASGKVCLWM
ncbi:WD repeat-containing protein [Cryphonectria parasitica EP155]|uniref:DNA damage-binding protein CMR1 n=1 Tax=Cryphonectria parasitica (strain ATCC 38755 / EP155) TaxID=660469 RepID=A0A9P5CM19_CRYP1|nr:WD repeat-containing protein [Cryphonectria parasitica EP155]KAF3763909.1 WD repeat-containing protein [Cryphonectria parasitica EP155]